MMYKINLDSKLDNDKLISMLTNIHYSKPFYNRFSKSKNRLFDINPSPLTVFEILLAKKDISFFYSFDDEIESLALNEFNVCYPKSVLEKAAYNININEATELTLKHHSFLSLRVKKGNFPLSSILESSRMLREDEKVLIQYILEPIDSRLNTNELAVVDFENGYLRKKIRINGEGIFKLGAKAVYYTASEFLSLISLAMTGEDIEIENLDKLENDALFRRGLSENTKAKSNLPSYDVSIRIGVESISRGKFLNELFEKAFNDMSEDNSLERRLLKKEKIIKAMNEQMPIDKVNRDLMSPNEVAQMIQLPTSSLQKEYNIANTEIQEMTVPEIFTRDGIQIATAKFRGKEIPINFPIKDKKNITQEELNSLCQCWLSIGKMGSGKTTNGENLALQLIELGMSVFAVDVADGKLIDNIEGRLPKNFNKIVDLNFGDTKHPIPLSWSEAVQWGDNVNVGTKIASQLKNFLNKLSKSETSDRMERFLGAAAKAVYRNPDANLYEVVMCLVDADFRHKIIRDNEIEGRVKQTLLQLDDPKTGTKSSYIAGIMDRIEALLDNEYVANCLLQRANPEINFRKWADEGYFVGIRVPKDVLLDDATDLLVTYIVSKLWLAILSRGNIEEKDRKPCFLILDEPHQFPTVLTELYSIIREMRKWRLGMIILAHEFGDFKSMEKLLKSAGTNYFVYSTSEETYKDLKSEINNYSIDQCLKTPWHHAIICMRYMNHSICIMGHMNSPKKPIKRHIENIYGRDVREVENEICSLEF